MFVTIPHASCIFQKFCIPKLHIDGCFSKTPQYDGVIIAVVATAFNGQNLLLVAAWVPSENIDNLVWVVGMLIISDISVHSVPLCADRGKLLHAAAVLQKEDNVVLSLKCCLEHIIRNVFFLNSPLTQTRNKCSETHLAKCKPHQTLIFSFSTL